MTGLARHVLLIGFMGAGKSSVGRVLATHLGAPFVDLDDLITTRAVRTVPQIFAEEGEPGFRELESAALESLVGESPTVVACGGGIVGREENRRMLHRLGTVVYLSVTAEESIRRCGAGTERPLLADRSAEEIADLLAKREPLYTEVADITVDTDELPPDVVAGLIERAMRTSASDHEMHPETKEHE